MGIIKWKQAMLEKSDCKERELCASGGNDLLFEMNIIICSQDSQIPTFRNETFFC